MADKVQKIRAEVERLQNELIQEKEKGYGSDTDDACILELQNVLTFIDSLEEDTPPLTKVNSTPSHIEGERGVCSQQEEFSIVIVLNGQRHRQVLHKGCFSKKECKEKCSLYERCQRCCIDLCMIFFHDPHCHFVEEPVSEELEEAAIYYADTHTEWFDSDGNPHVSPAFKAGAEWQKKQDQSTIELAEDHAMLAGIIKGTEHTIGNVRSILNKVAYQNNGLDVNGDYCEQPYVELDNEFRKLLKED